MRENEEKYISLQENPFSKIILDHIQDDVADLRRGFRIEDRREVPDINVFEDLTYSVNKFLSSLSVILGIPGCGKSNTVAVIAEELLSLGVSLSIIDVEGEHWSLKEMFPHICIIGDTRHSEIKISDNEEIAKELAKEVIYKQKAVIIDLSRTSDYTRTLFLLNYFNTLYDECEDLYFKQNQTVHTIIIEEAHNFIPLRFYSRDEKFNQLLGALKAATRTIATQGRKRGLGVILASQRNQIIDRSITAMADQHLLHKATEVNDLKLYADLTGIPFAVIKNVVPSLQVGQVLFRSGDMKGVYKVRLRYTFHPARTPGYADVKRWRERIGESSEEYGEGML